MDQAQGKLAAKCSSGPEVPNRPGAPLRRITLTDSTPATHCRLLRRRSRKQMIAIVLHLVPRATRTSHTTRTLQTHLTSTAWAGRMTHEPERDSISHFTLTGCHVSRLHPPERANSPAPRPGPSASRHEMHRGASFGGGLTGKRWQPHLRRTTKTTGRRECHWEEH